MWDVYTENYKTCIKDIKDALNKYLYYVHRLKESVIWNILSPEINV